ncbi:MAG: DUF2508 family protein [Clostridia bacterium]
MNAVAKLTSTDWLKKNEPVKSKEEHILDDIHTLCINMERAYARFEFEQDADLIESSIYEIKSLKAQYRYLLRMAKENGVTCPQTLLTNFEKEEAW